MTTPTTATRAKLSHDRVALLGIQALLAYEWLSAGWGKVSTPDFVANISQTFAAFAAKNPHGWYKSFLEGYATAHATTLAQAVQYGQLAAGAALLLSLGLTLFWHHPKSGRIARPIAVLALLGGLLMNANFYLAAGWTSPGTKTANLVMFWVQAALAYALLRECAAAMKSAAADTASTPPATK